jgi:2-(1,2-epoxy-1,2-dihydrophenyl)acetyl-CoA isomerase
MNRVYGRAIRALHSHPKPVVALVEGVAAGAGANLAFACDLVYAARGARFCEIFVRRGLSLDCGGSWLLPRLVGMQRAKELAFFGDWITVETAREYGLVNAIFEPDAIEAGVDEKLAALAERPPIALAQIKQSLHRASVLSMTEALEIEAVAQAACTSTEDTAEGMRAFLEKRPPQFTGR